MSLKHKIVYKSLKFHTKKLWNEDKLSYQISLAALRYKLSTSCFIEVGQEHNDYVNNKHTIRFYEFVEIKF